MHETTMKRAASRLVYYNLYLHIDGCPVRRYIGSSYTQ